MVRTGLTGEGGLQRVGVIGGVSGARVVHGGVIMTRDDQVWSIEFEGVTHV